MLWNDALFTGRLFFVSQADVCGEIDTYDFFPWCRWKKSCTTWDVWIPVNNGRNYQAQLVPTTYVWYGAYGPHIFPLSPLLIFINFSCFKASCSILRLPHDLLIPSSKGHTGILEFAPLRNFPNWKEVAWSLEILWQGLLGKWFFPLPHLGFLNYGTGAVSGV